ncbi:BON domain-containing protein [Acidicapsa ligni]|uniref:BON domain-containing protein n=1 Tax=Acidicapsa ligni TaxID=542300 RepID=UPI0021DFEBF4|nr:BON domain-containing protein [Acidicapsa ligni]
MKTISITPRLFTLYSTLALASLCVISFPGYGQDQSTPSTAPDNSAKNKKHDITADKQTNASADLQVTAQIRKAIIAEKSLSTYAHNVKIITLNGMVTLKGPVKSDSEKQTVADLAAKAAGGADRITNDITVK